MAENSAREAEEALGVKPERSKSAIEMPLDSIPQRQTAFMTKRWLDKGPLRLWLRRALISSGASGVDAAMGTSIVMGDETELSPGKAVARWMELAARHEIPPSIRKEYVCYWPNEDFYKESPPVFNRVEQVRESAEKDHAEGESRTKSEMVPECMQQSRTCLLPRRLLENFWLDRSRSPAPVHPKAQTLPSSVLPTDPRQTMSSLNSYVTPSMLPLPKADGTV